MNTQNFVNEERSKMKLPIGSYVLIVAQIISFFSVLIPQIQQVIDNMNNRFENSFGEYYYVSYTYISTESWMGIFVLVAIAVLAIKNNHKLINLVLLSEVGVVSIIGLLQVLLNLHQFNYYTSFNTSYYSYTDAASAILSNLFYLVLVLTVLLFALRDYGISVINISNKVVMIVSIVSLVGAILLNVGNMINLYDMLGNEVSFYYIGTLLSYIGLFLIGARFANPYKKGSMPDESLQDE